VGKKKAKDLQFFVNVIDAVESLEQNRRSMYDPDEIEEEQRERDRRKKTNSGVYSGPSDPLLHPL
jgi:nucleosome binding factor SPN SPT16 subunit